MYDRIGALAIKLKELQGRFDPGTLSHITHPPENTLTLDQVNALQEAAEELASIRSRLEELIGIIDECDTERMGQLAESDEVQALASFNFDAHQRGAFEEIDRGDEETLDADQESATGSAIDKLNELVTDAGSELQEMHGLIESAIQRLDGLE